MGCGYFFLIIVPGQALALVNREYKGRLEIILVSGISVEMIAAGKWYALMLQTIILVVTTIPYLLVTYLFAGDAVLWDLLYLLLNFLGSLPLTALALSLTGVGISPPAVRLGGS